MKELKAAIEAAQKAGRILKSYYGKKFEVFNKESQLPLSIQFILLSIFIAFNVPLFK